MASKKTKSCRTEDYYLSFSPAGLKSARADLRAELMAKRPEKTDLKLERADLGPGAEKTD